MWIKRHPVDPSTSSSYTLFIEQAFSLPSLTYLGTLLDRSFAPNTVILHLIDGPYALDLSPATTQQPSKPASAVPTSSYSTLMRLSSLDDSIQDALASREKLASQINDILEKQTIDQDLTIARQKVDLTQKYIERQTLLVSQARKKLSEKQMSIVARRQGITSAQAAQERTKPVLFEAETETIEGQKRLLLAREGMRGQLRRICEELLQAFPIEPTAKTLLFTIAGLHIPNSNFLDSSIPEEEISAALGHVALVVHTLSHYLAVALPYPIEWFGSRSIIRDEISLLNDPNRIFPLFSKGSIQFRFEYAVFLLNKDIEALVEKSSLKVQDIRLTLPNLKYLLFCLSAGTEELPLRKAGGIRGLIGGGSLRGTPNVSRRGSEDETPRLGSKGRENGRVDAAADLRRTLGSGLVFSDEPGLSLRTKGLRENRS